MGWTGTVLWWLPTFAVVAMTGLGLAAAIVLPRSARDRRTWAGVILVCGIIAIAVSAWQQERGWARFAELRALGAELDAIGRLLPQPAPRASAESVGAAIAALGARIHELETEVAALREKSASRALDAAAVAGMADYLRPFGSHRVVVSCVPDDVEAFGYANQLANVLRSAGWEAPGPQTTTIFGKTPAMRLSLYVPAGQPPDTVQILIDAFAKFNIPYKSAIAPSEAVPVAGTVELFVPPKP